MVSLSERMVGVRQKITTDVEGTKKFYKAAWEKLNSDKPEDEFFMQANAVFWMFTYPMFAVPATIAGSIRAFLKAPNKLA